jgi:hypothetical protein
VCAAAASAQDAGQAAGGEANLKLPDLSQVSFVGGDDASSVSDNKKAIAICTQQSQKGMLNIFIAVFLPHSCLRSSSRSFSSAAWCP